MWFQAYQWLENNSWIVAINSTTKGSATLEVFHYLGLFLVVGSSALVNLRLLGYGGRRLSLNQMVPQLFGIMWIGLISSFASGFILFAGTATQYYHNEVFNLKIGLIVVAVLCAIAIQRNVPAWSRMPAVPPSAKAIAVVSLVLWAAAIVVAVEIPALTYVG